MMRLGIELKLLEEDVLRIETTVHQVIWNRRGAQGFTEVTMIACGPGSSVGIATELWAGRSGIETPDTT